MPKINTHTAGRLASEQVGVPSLDQSGAIIGDAVARVASKAVSLIDQSLTKQRNLLQQAELTKTVSQFDSDMIVATEDIKQQNLNTPDEGLKQLQEKRKELFTQYKDSITNQDVKIRFDGAGSANMARGNAMDQLWAFKANNVKIQQFYADRLSNDAAFAGQTDNLDEVIEKAVLLDSDRESFYQAWDSVVDGSRIIDAGQESMVKAYFYGQLSKGNAFKVLKEIEDGRFGPADDSNGLISPVELKALKTAAKKMALAGKDDAAALALVNAVQENFKVDEALSQPISVTEEKINSLSFLIGKRKELVGSGVVSPEEIGVLEKQLGLLKDIRGAQLSRNDVFIVPDENFQAEMSARYFGLFKKGRLQEGFKGTLEDLFKFQQDMVKNRNKLDPAFFKKYFALSESAFQADIQEIATEGSKFKAGPGFFGGDFGFKKEKRISSSEGLRDVFSSVIEKHNPDDGNKFLFETMRFFYDDLSERVDITNLDEFSQVPQKDLDQIMEVAQRKAQLKKLGLPIYLQNKDLVYSVGRSYIITGFAADGMPEVEER